MTKSFKKAALPLAAALALPPLGILVLGEIYSMIFNPDLALGTAARVAGAFKPAVFGLTGALVAVFALVAWRMLDPLFARIDGRDVEESKARSAAIGLPWFLMSINVGFWTAGTVAFYAANGWKAPNGTPFGWTIAFKASEGVASALFSSLLANVVLIGPKKSLGMREVRAGERDLFAESADYLILGLGLALMATRIGYAARYFLLRPDGNPGPSAVAGSMAAVAAAVTALCGTLLALSRRERTERVALLADRLKALADGGGADLSVSLELFSFDGVGRATGSFNVFAASLRGILGEVKSAAAALSLGCDALERKTEMMVRALGGISAAVEEARRLVDREAEGAVRSARAAEAIKGEAEALDRAVEAQSARVAESSASVEQMIASVRSVDRSTASVNSSYGSLLAAADEGRVKLEEVSRLVAAVAEKSRALGETNAMIAGIASKTNLLAMNAAIEAAHAGSAGAGFSVVADEIRSLAEGSSAQSKEVRRSLSEMRSAAESIVGAAQAAKDGFARVRTQIEEVSRLEEGIRTALAEQSRGGEEVHRALSEMRDAMAEIRSRSGEMRAGSALVLERMDDAAGLAESSRSGAEAISAAAADIESVFGSIREMIAETVGAISRLEAVSARFKV